MRELTGAEGENFLCTYLGFFGVYSTENLMAIQNIYMIKGFKVELAELCGKNGVLVWDTWVFGVFLARIRREPGKKEVIWIAYA